jgi:hypothetical protein
MIGHRAILAGLTLAAALALTGCRGGLATGPDLGLRGPASLSGRVVTADQRPVAGAFVVVEGAGALQSARTGPDGRYRLQVVWLEGEEGAAGVAPLRAQVTAAGYRPVALKLALARGAARQDFRLARSS